MPVCARKVKANRRRDAAAAGVRTNLAEITSPIGDHRPSVGPRGEQAGSECGGHWPTGRRRNADHLIRILPRLQLLALRPGTWSSCAGARSASPFDKSDSSSCGSPPETLDVSGRAGGGSGNDGAPAPARAAWRPGLRCRRWHRLVPESIAVEPPRWQARRSLNVVTTSMRRIALRLRRSVLPRTRPLAPRCRSALRPATASCGCSPALVPCIFGLHAAVLGSPLVEAGRVEAVVTAQLGHPHAGVLMFAGT